MKKQRTDPHAAKWEEWYRKRIDFDHKIASALRKIAAKLDSGRHGQRRKK
jgi:hypothetical protein